MAGKLLLLTRAEWYRRCLFAAVRGLWHGKKGVRKEQETLMPSIIPSPSSRRGPAALETPQPAEFPLPLTDPSCYQSKEFGSRVCIPEDWWRNGANLGGTQSPPSQGESSRAKATGCGQGQLPGSRSAQELHHEADFLGSYVLKTQPIFRLCFQSQIHPKNKLNNRVMDIS